MGGEKREERDQAKELEDVHRDADSSCALMLLGEQEKERMPVWSLRYTKED